MYIDRELLACWKDSSIDTYIDSSYASLNLLLIEILTYFLGLSSCVG